ncbi:MAG: hypothetical protein Q4B85_08485 [Lachnospiraceae bacterium]|nr:hypothetical protein [Lachnospiraceae bacterium]
MKMGKGPVIMGATGIVLAGLIVGGVLFNKAKSADSEAAGGENSVAMAEYSDDESGVDSGSSMGENSEEQDSDGSAKQKNAADDAILDDPEIVGDNHPDPGLSGFEPNYQGFGPQYTKKENQNQDITDDSAVQEITFPYEIPDTGIIVDQMLSYDGAYMEDGSGDEIGGVAAITFTNNGSSAIEFIQFIAVQNGVERRFCASDIPQGAQCLAMEVNRAGFDGSPCTSFVADTAWADSLDMASSQISVEENEEGTLTVTNVSGADIPCVRIFYKYYMSDMDAYVGGITFNAKITDLKAGDTTIISPSHYLAGYSRVMEVRTYDADN